jgi:diguanylate cyclase (GGDEF)-like protein
VPFVGEQGKILQYIAIRADITEQKLAEQEAKRLALFDDLTGLPNRRFLQEKIGELCSAKAGVNFHALMLLDLDNFKDINDSFGHGIGDDLLKQVAHRIQQFTNSAVNCARLGGDEFVLLLTELGESQAQTLGYLLQMAQNICTFLAEPYQLSGKLVRTSASIGVSIFSNDVEDPSEILKQADIALYQSKANGRNCVTFFDPVLQRAMDRRNETLRELKTAIERDELSLHYQPVVNANNRIKGVEALVRWHSPSLGPISPEVFIPLAEESTLILDIGQWVLSTACKQIHDWRSHPTRKHWVVAVNVSAKQLQRENFVASVVATVNQYAIPPASLQLEITESMLQDDIKNTTLAMAELKALGIRFSLDDFGTGYSSLNYLTKLPINTLKIDRSFVDRMLQSTEDASVVKTILSLASSLALDVVAEGVETEAQFMFLKQQHCPHFQGYLFSKPVSPAHLPEDNTLAL